MKTAYSDPSEWRDQVREIFGDDAQQIITIFTNVLAEYQQDEEEVFDQVEIAVTEEEVAEWLLAARDACETMERENPVYDIVWYAGLALARIYFDRDEMAPDPRLGDAAKFFLTASEAADDDDE